MLVDDGRIVEVAARSGQQVPTGVQLYDFGDYWIMPGYIDLHIHGGAGYDVMDGNCDALPAVEQFLVRHGVTGYFPTTVTAPVDLTLRSLERLANTIEDRESGNKKEVQARALPLGIHLEGPFISHERRGVHPPEYLLKPTLAMFERFWQASRGRIRVMTIAPELENASEVIAEAARRGVLVSLGHSDADFATAQRGIAAGARHATHAFNAMRPLGHRSPGILGAVLVDDSISADMIVDGIHVDPPVVKLFARAKGHERAVLITDAISATGMPNGRYRLGSFEVDVLDGKCTGPGGTLAGSVLTMDRAVQNLMQFAEWNLWQAASTASRNPARVVGVANKGNIAIGADADFIVLTSEGEVRRTFVGGTECAR